MVKSEINYDFHFFSFLRSLMWVHPTVTVSVLTNHRLRFCHHLQSRFSVTVREAQLAHLYQKGNQDSHQAFSPRPSTETSARFGGENVLATDYSGTMGGIWAHLAAKTYQFWTTLPLHHFAPKPAPALQMLPCTKQNKPGQCQCLSPLGTRPGRALLQKKDFSLWEHNACFEA